MDVRHLNLVSPYSDYSDTYSLDYGRATGRVELSAAQKLERDAEALADVVDAYRTVVRLSRTQPNSRNWRTAYLTYSDANVRYSKLTGMTTTAVAEKVHSIAECFTAA